MIAGLIRHMAGKQTKLNNQESTTSERGSEQSAMDLLSPGRKVKLLRQMQKFWPYRAAKLAPALLATTE